MLLHEIHIGVGLGVIKFKVLVFLSLQHKIQYVGQYYKLLSAVRTLESFSNCRSI